jgi:hypothetical protein
MNRLRTGPSWVCPGDSCPESVFIATVRPRLVSRAFIHFTHATGAEFGSDLIRTDTICASDRRNAP